MDVDPMNDSPVWHESSRECRQSCQQRKGLRMAVGPGSQAIRPAEWPLQRLKREDEHARGAAFWQA